MNYRKTLRKIIKENPQAMTTFWYHFNTFCLKNDETPSADLFNAFSRAVLKPSMRPKGFWGVFPIKKMIIKQPKPKAKFCLISYSYQIR